MNDNLQQQLIKDLLVESFDALDRFDREMLAIEKGEADAETLNDAFRVIHTLKGSCGCIGLNKIESVAHVGESLLSLLRDGKITHNAVMIKALLEYSDALKEMLRTLEQTGQQGAMDYSPLLQRLQALQDGTTEPEKPAPARLGCLTRSRRRPRLPNCLLRRVRRPPTPRHRDLLRRQRNLPARRNRRLVRARRFPIAPSGSMWGNWTS